MNIWILNHYATSPDSIGISRHYDLSKYLAKKGHKVTIFASSFNHQTRTEEHIHDNSKFKRTSYSGVDFVWIKTALYTKNNHNRIKNILDYSRRLFLLLKNYPEKPDLIIGSLMHPIAPMIADYYSNKWNVPFYFEERDLWPQSLIDLGKVKETNPLVKALSLLEKKFYKDSTKIIYLFDKANKYAIQQGVKEKKIIYIPNGVDLERINENKNEEIPNTLHNYFNERKDKLIGIYAGAHSLANDLFSLAEAIKNVSDDRYEFLFIGDGPDKQAVMDFAEKNSIKNLFFHEAIPKNKLHAVLHKCDFGMIKFKDLPVYQWGVSPNKIYDYMGSGLPVIMGLNQDHKTIEDSNSGIVIKDQFETQLGLILNELSSDSIEIMGENAKNLAINTYSWEKLSEELEEFMHTDVRGDS